MVETGAFITSVCDLPVAKSPILDHHIDDCTQGCQPRQYCNIDPFPALLHIVEAADCNRVQHIKYPEEGQIHQDDAEFIVRERLDRDHPEAKVNLEQVVGDKRNCERARDDRQNQQDALPKIQKDERNASLIQTDSLATEEEPANHHQDDGEQTVNDCRDPDEKDRRSEEKDWANARCIDERRYGRIEIAGDVCSQNQTDPEPNACFSVWRGLGNNNLTGFKHAKVAVVQQHHPERENEHRKTNQSHDVEEIFPLPDLGCARDRRPAPIEKVDSVSEHNARRHGVPRVNLIRRVDGPNGFSVPYRPFAQDADAARFPAVCRINTKVQSNTTVCARDRKSRQIRCNDLLGCKGGYASRYSDSG